MTLTTDSVFAESALAVLGAEHNDWSKRSQPRNHQGDSIGVRPKHSFRSFCCLSFSTVVRQLFRRWNERHSCRSLAAKRRLNSGPGWSEAKPRVTALSSSSVQGRPPRPCGAWGGQQDQPFPTAGPSPIREISESVTNLEKIYPLYFQHILPAQPRMPATAALS